MKISDSGIKSDITAILSLLFCMIVYLLFGVKGAAIYIGVDIFSRVLNIAVSCYRLHKLK